MIHPEAGRRRALRLVSLAALLLAHAASGQGVVRGFITDAERGPLPGANVALARLGGEGELRGAVTDAQGFYEIGGLALGRYAVRVTYVGYSTLRDTLAVAEGVTTFNRDLIPDQEALGEVVVQAEGGAADVSGGLQRIRPADVARVPAPDVAGDLAVYLQSLPGVVAIGDRGGGLYVRGGTPSQNLILVDGAPIYQPFHLVGFFSAFPEDLVSTADFYAGGYGARYTGRVSSVLDVSIREGNYERIRAAATAGPFVVSGQAEGPIVAGQSSWLASARTSVIEPLAETLLGEPLPVRFADGLVKVSASTGGTRCSVTGIGTYDRGSIEPEEDDVFAWSNAVLAGRCIFAPSDVPGRVDVTASLSHLNSSVGPPTSFLRDEGRERESRLTEARFGAELARPVGRSTLRYGAQASIYGTSYRLGETFTGVRASDELILGGAAHIEAEVPVGALTVTPGVAFALQPYSFSAGVEPRLRVTWAPTGSSGPEVALASGLYRQSVVGLVDERDAGSPFIAWTGPPESFSETRALHAVLGGSVPLGGGLRLGAEAYAKRLDDLPVPIWSARAEFTTQLTSARATSLGGDVRAEWQGRKLYAYLAYGYGRTEYVATQGNFGQIYGAPFQEYNPAHDRRHQIQATTQAEVGRFELIARWQFGSGLPYTRPFGFDTVVPPFGLPEVREEPGFRRVLFERPFNGRLPTYHRLDVSAGTEVDLGRAALDVRAGAINAYDRDNVFYYDVFRARRVDQLPLVPYVSARIRSKS